MTLLPNGWRIAPAGRHVMVGDLPLAMLVSPDGRWAIVTNNGYEKPTLTIVELDTLSSPRQDFRRRRLARPRLASRRQASLRFGRRRRNGPRAPLAAREAEGRPDVRRRQGRQGRLPRRSRDPSGRDAGSTSWTCSAQRLSALDLAIRRGREAGESAGGALLLPRFAGRSDALRLALGRREGAALRRGDARAAGRASRGRASQRHGPVRGREASLRRVRQHELGLGRRSRFAEPRPSRFRSPSRPARRRARRPTRSALSPDGRTLLVANADNNAVAVVDVARPSASRVAGFIPTGWYPTGVQFTPDGRRILVLSGKGLTSMPNPRGPQPGADGDQSQYIGAMLTGTLSVLQHSRSGRARGATRRPSVA